MADKFSIGIRSKNMGAIRSNNTKLEEIISKELWSRGLRFRKNVKSLFGKPDIAIKKYKVIVFIDSCFWHFCTLHCKVPKTNRDYWINKLHRNKARDGEVTQYYVDNGWNILRIWEHQIKEEYASTIDTIECFIRKCKQKHSILTNPPKR